MKKTEHRYGFITRASAILMTCLSSSVALGATGNESQVGTLTAIQGEVKVFSHPGKSISGPPPHALFEGEYYSVRDAKTGDRIEKGNIVRTTPGSSARVIYENGDQFHVGSGTAYRVNWKDNKGDKDGPKTQTQVNLMYGKLRGIIEKKGPRSKMFLKTSTVSMGVRGTDFFVDDGGKGAGSQITVLRGAVEVKPETPKAKPIEVKSGFSATVTAPPAPPAPAAGEAKKTVTAAAPAPAPAPEVKLTQTTKEDLVVVQKTSAATQIRKEVQEAALAPEVKQKLEVLEKKAVQTTLKDIKEGDPKLYAQLMGQKAEVKSVDEINTDAVKSIYKDAPQALPAAKKPSWRELEESGKDSYDKYFKITE